jgi:hypothetical protein
MKILLVGAAALALSGCVDHAAQQRAAAYTDASLEYQRQRNLAETARCQAWLGDARFDQIRHRITGAEPTVAQMADTRMPTATERALLVQWATALDGCDSYGYGPPIGVTREQRQLALASLAAGEMSYGAYQRKIAETRMAWREQGQRDAAQAAAHAVATQAGVQAAIEQARAQAAADALADTLAAGITAAIFSSGRRRR